MYIWMHGTMEANVREPESYVMQLEMLKRGYIAVQAGYDDDMFGYVNSPGKLLILTLMYKAHLYDDVTEHFVCPCLCEYYTHQDVKEAIFTKAFWIRHGQSLMAMMKTRSFHRCVMDQMLWLIAIWALPCMVTRKELNLEV